MKKSKNRLAALLLICPFFISWQTDGSVIQNPENSKASHTQIVINSYSKDKQVYFGISEIIRVSKERGIDVYTGRVKKEDVSLAITINIMSDSAQASAAVNAAGLKMPEFKGWQCYSIRKKKEKNDLNIWILSTDKTGAMYGCLDIAEAINNQTINNITDSDNKPYLERRGLKFNIPLDLRTPSYSDLSDAFQQNITVMWEMDFWKQQFDEMARNRYNLISLWSLNPFPSLVKVPEFPDIALNDVWRTTEKLENVYPTDGTGNLNQELLENHEIVKKITINEKIDFWRKVMECAKDRGIEVYLFTWNIFTFGENGKYGIDNNRSNDTTIAYFRASVREMVLTYPLLAGFGITAGENMGGKNKQYTNEEWLWKTYGEGIRDALKKQPGRKIRLIHRFHQTGLTEILDEFREYPGIMDLSIKYSIAHMYSITDPPFARGAFELLPPNRRTWLTVRNDDIYSFRWGNPDYARQYLLNIPSREKVAGYYMGSDGYCLGREFLGKRQYIAPAAGNTKTMVFIYALGPAELQSLSVR